MKRNTKLNSRCPPTHAWDFTYAAEQPGEWWGRSCSQREETRDRRLSARGLQQGTRREAVGGSGSRRLCPPAAAVLNSDLDVAGTQSLPKASFLLRLFF